jgi:tetratricopeptide (TPR) repeat protein
MKKVMVPSIFIAIFSMLLNFSSAFAQNSAYTCVHKGLAIETEKFSESDKKATFDKLNGIISSIEKDPSVSASISAYKLPNDLQGKKAEAEDILYHIDNSFNYKEETSLSKTFTQPNGMTINYTVTYVEQKISYASTTLLSSALSSCKDGKFSFDCDTSSFVYLAVLESKFTLKNLPVVLLLCPSHALLRWKFSDGSYINWETTTGEKPSDKENKYYEDNCREITPGSDAFYSLFYANRGTAKYEKNDYTGALGDLNKAIELDPKDVYAYASRAGLKVSTGDFAGAVGDLNRAMEVGVSGYASWIYDVRGYAKLKLEDYEGALADLNKAIELGVDSYHERGTARFKLMDYTGALADLDKAMELNPDDEAIHTSRELVRGWIEFTGSQAYEDSGDAKSKHGDYKGAIADYDNVIKMDPQNAETYRTRAFLKYATQDYHGALADYNKVIELDPKNAKAYKGRGLAKFKLDDYDGAIADYNKAAKLDPANSASYEGFRKAAEQKRVQANAK